MLAETVDEFILSEGVCAFGVSMVSLAAGRIIGDRAVVGKD